MVTHTQARRAGAARQAAPLRPPRRTPRRRTVLHKCELRQWCAVGGGHALCRPGGRTPVAMPGPRAQTWHPVSAGSVAPPGTRRARARVALRCLEVARPPRRAAGGRNGAAPGPPDVDGTAIGPVASAHTGHPAGRGGRCGLSEGAQHACMAAGGLAACRSSLALRETRQAPARASFRGGGFCTMASQTLVRDWPSINWRCWWPCLDWSRALCGRRWMSADKSDFVRVPASAGSTIWPGVC